MEFYSDCLRRTIATSAAPSAMKATVPAILAKEDDSSVSSACCSCDRDNVVKVRTYWKVIEYEKAMFNAMLGI